MSFLSVAFVCLYLVALLARVVSSRWARLLPAFHFVLLGLSLIFYVWHVPEYVALIIVSTCVDFWTGWELGQAAPYQRLKRRLLLMFSLTVNLGLLGTFKYADFFFELAGSSYALGLVLPVGISFYTFQSMSYTIDVYRGDVEAEPSLWRLLLYVSFFPQLVAGPIVRSSQFLYQLSRRRPLRWASFSEGLYQIVRGLFLKMVIADNLGIVVDEEYENAVAGGDNASVAVGVVVLFSCQLFCDFAGYTAIARGVAYTLGFRLPKNFDAPFIARTFQEFWRRWHITLGTWMRDYLYIPLGGGRGRRGRVAINLAIVLIISGLWHGANTTFVVWGAMHAVAIVVERFMGISGGRRSGGALPRALAPLWFIVVQGVWIASLGFFRAESVADGWQLIQNAGAGLASALEPESASLFGASDSKLRVAWWFTLAVWLAHARAAVRGWLGPARPLERGFYFGVMLYAVVTLYTVDQRFIYFQF